MNYCLGRCPGGKGRVARGWKTLRVHSPLWPKASSYTIKAYLLAKHQCNPSTAWNRAHQGKLSDKEKKKKMHRTGKSTVRHIWQLLDLVIIYTQIQGPNFPHTLPGANSIFLSIISEIFKYTIIDLHVSIIDYVFRSIKEILIYFFILIKKYLDSVLPLCLYIYLFNSLFQGD